MKNLPSQQVVELKRQDLISLLDEISLPCVLVNYESGIIIAPNIFFAEQIQLGISELIGLNINDVIKGIDLENIYDGEGQTVSFVNRNNETNQSQVNIKYISPGEKLVFISFMTKEIEKRNSGWYWKKFSQHQNLLSAKFSQLTLDELFTYIIATGKELTGYDEVVIFTENNSSEFLDLYSPQETVFPKIIPKMEVKRITEIDYWEPGKRVLSEIHRVGRLNKFNSIITIPVSNNKRIFALLILASIFQNHIELERDLLDQFATWVSISIDKFIELNQDETNRKEMLSNLEKLEMYYANSSESFLVVDENNKIIEFNSNFQKLLSYLPIEILNKNLETIIQNPALMHQLKNASTPEIVTTNLEILDRNGNKKWITPRVIPISRGNNNNRKIILINDETEKWAANNTISLLQKNAVLGEIISEFAHDVRNIINRLTTGLQLLAKRVELNDAGLGSLQELKSECSNMTDLMESVLSYSKQNYENFQKIDLKELINRNIYRLQKRANANNISIILNSSDFDCTIMADPRSIERVITNLINNGIEAIGASGGAVSVNISLSEEHPGYQCIQIADTGPGIPPEIEGKLFQKFSTGKVEGTGLGLFITQKIIEFHKGWIDFETFPGGTIFNIFIPKENTGEHL